jgi:hypothetical protein
VHDQAWPLNEVDAFILAKQEAAGLQPGPEAEAHAWLRRVTFDLTGLPPTEAEIQHFLADLERDNRTRGQSDKEKSLSLSPHPIVSLSGTSPHERVVDRLLSSRAYGERWARHWLDLVGYAEQIGTEGKVFAEHAWRYRDYLVESFHHDKPFDRFIREQLAGDLLPAASPQERRENLIATGFIVLGDVDINAIDKLKDRLSKSKIVNLVEAMQVASAFVRDPKMPASTRLKAIEQIARMAGWEKQVNPASEAIDGVTIAFVGGSDGEQKA